MNPELLKLLRSQLSIPLDRAIALLKANEGNINACIESFHRENVLEICRLTDCDEELALKHYQTAKYDLEKAAKRIHSIQIVFTTRVHPEPIDKIGFIIWPENALGEPIPSVKRNDVFVPGSDFDLILADFKSVFPLKNPRTGRMQNQFDHTGHNLFDRKSSEIIIQRLEQDRTSDPNIKQFKRDLIVWMRAQLETAEILVVFGNL